MRTISEEEKDYHDYNDAFLKYSDLLEDKIDDHIRNSHNRLKVSKLMEEYILVHCIINSASKLGNT